MHTLTAERVNSWVAQTKGADFHLPLHRSERLLEWEDQETRKWGHTVCSHTHSHSLSLSIFIGVENLNKFFSDTAFKFSQLPFEMVEIPGNKT